MNKSYHIVVTQEHIDSGRPVSSFSFELEEPI